MQRIKYQEKNLRHAAHAAAQTLKRGHAIIFPTDTLYGLGVDAMREDAIERFFALKKRPANKPVPIFVKDITMAKKLAFIDKRQEEILQKLWPGPYTLVLFKKKEVSSRLTAGTQKIGLRIPNNAFCRALLSKFNGPITASSANISGMAGSGEIDKIISQFKKHSLEPELIVDAGNISNIVPSTVLDITRKEPRILRINPTTIETIQQITDLNL